MLRTTGVKLRLSKLPRKVILRILSSCLIVELIFSIRIRVERVHSIMRDVNLKLKNFLCISYGELIGKPRGDVNARDVRGETLLIAATKRGDLDAVGSLLALDADLFIEDSTGATALVYARGNPAMEHLFAKKLDVAIGGLFPTRQMGVNAQDKRGETALIAATKRVDSRVVASLLAQGADPFIQDSTKKTALDYARGNSALEKLFAKALHQTVRSLFPPRELDINVRNEQGETALIAATKRDDVAVVKSLLVLDADPFMEDTTQKTALDYARGNPEMEQAFADKLGVEVQELSGMVQKLIIEPLSH